MSKVQRAIEARKKANNAYDYMDSVIADEKRKLQIAKFEISTSKKIERRMKNDRMATMERDNQISLHQRRRDLADLYNDEMEQWKAEVLANVETQEDRKARIMERAYALRDERERARQEHVKAALDQQWRDACDDARTLDSEALLLHVSKERKAQIDEKIKNKIRLTDDEKKFNEEWKKHVENLEIIEKQKEEHRRQIDHETSEKIKDQIQQNKQRKQQQREITRKEDEEEIQQIRDALADEERLQRQRQVEANQRRKEILETNAQAREIEEAEKQLRKAQDMALLRFALAKEREAQEAEEAKKNANRQAALEYKKYLEEQMIRDADDAAHLDEMRKLEEEKVWKARDDALAARQAARDYLMKMVDEGRQEQIRNKRETELNQKQEERVWSERFLKDSEEGMRQERLEAEARRQVAIQNNYQLKDQINYRREKEEKEKQDEYLAYKHMLKVEEMHKKKLAEQGGVARTYRPLKQSQWYS